MNSIGKELEQDLVAVGVKIGYFEINGYDYFLFTDFSQNIH